MEQCEIQDCERMLKKMQTVLREKDPEQCFEQEQSVRLHEALPGQIHGIFRLEAQVLG